MDSHILSAVVTLNGKKYCLHREDMGLKVCSISEIQSHENYQFLNGTFPDPAKGESVFNLTFGPVASGLFESIKFNIRTYGERILSVTPEWDFKNRKIKISSEPNDRALLKIERINALYSASYSSLYCHLIEKMAETDPSYDVQLARIIMIEAERIGSHILVIQRLAEAASQNVAKHHLSALRERLLRTIAVTFGHRYFFGMNAVGGLARSVELEKFRDEIAAIAREFSDIWELIKVSRIFIDRIIGVGKTYREWYVGPTLRASGGNFDSRASGWLPYSDFGFSVVSGGSGDSFARAMVRAEEIMESARIIDEIISSKRQIIKEQNISNTAASGYAFDGVESPGGELIMGIELNGGRVYQPFIRSSSWCNLPAFTEGIRGGILTDFSFGLESHGLFACEMGDLL